MDENTKGRLSRLIEQIKSDYSGPFQEIARMLTEPLHAVAQDGTVPNSRVESIIDHVHSVLRALPDPRSVNARFGFDAALIQQLMRELVTDGVPLISNPVVPKYTTGRDWKHQPVPLLGWAGEEPDGRELTVHVVTIPGRDELADVELLHYPWLLHELAHFILERRGEQFYKRFGQFVEGALASISFRGLASREAARTFATAQSDALRRYWLPRHGVANWPIEIAADLMALRVLGPAFLDSYASRVRHEKPFVLEDVHPPYHARGQALYDAAVRLGWEIEANSLRELLEGWRAIPDYYNRGNYYVNFVRQDFLLKCVKEGLALWSELGLPRCDSPRLERLREQLREGRPPGIGTDLILAYWLVQSDPELGRFAGSTQEWVQRCADSVTLESP